MPIYDRTSSQEYVKYILENQGEPKGNAPKPDQVDADATNIILTFSSAPPSGTYYYWWKAEV